MRKIKKLRYSSSWSKMEQAIRIQDWPQATLKNNLIYRKKERRVK